MQRIALALALGVLSIGARAAAAQTAGPAAKVGDFTGVYDFEAAANGGKVAGRLVLRGTAGNYSGSVAPDGQGVGTVTQVIPTDTNLVVTADLGDGAIATLRLKPAPTDSLNGTYEISNGQTGEIRSVRIRR